MRKAIANVKALAGKVKQNLTELYVGGLIIFGLPAIAYMYVNWKLALTVFIVVNTIVGLLMLRSTD